MLLPQEEIQKDRDVIRSGCNSVIGSKFSAAIADVVKIFPAVSLIFPLESDTQIKTTRVAFGGGVALANAFTFSGAATVQGTPQAFFLIGISALDLVKTFTK